MASRFFLVFILVILTIVNATLAAEAEKLQPVVDDTKKAADNATKSLIDSLGPSQDNPDYEIPLELAPGGVQVVDDYMPNISPTGGKDDSLAQPESDVNASPSSPASVSFSTVAVAAVGGAGLFFF